MMDGCNKCCKINTESLTCGSLQVLPWNNDTIIEKIDGCKWFRHVTDFFQYMHALNQGGMMISISISLLQFLFCKSKVNLKNVSGCNYSYRKRAIHRMDGYNWNCELHQYLWKKDDYKCLFQRNTVLLKTLDHCKHGCKCSFERTIRLK